jgi:hypothetical protein
MNATHTIKSASRYRLVGGFIFLTLASAAFTLQAFSADVAPAKTQIDAGAQARQDEQAYVVRSSTKIDFSESVIDGKMKAPEGFYLKGRSSQKMQNLLKLRPNFKKELEGSAEAAQTDYK